MGDFCKMILSFGLCVFAFNAFVNGFPADNEIRDTGYPEGVVTKEIPSKVSSFSIGLIKKLVREKPEENVLYSPLSTYAALMVLHLGAGEKTRKELSDVLKITGTEVDYDKLHDAFSKVLIEVEERNLSNENRRPQPIVANGLYVQKDHPIDKSFIQSLQKHYNATAMNVDFLEHAKEATDEINSFISENTLQRIKNFYETSLPSTTVAVLANAFHFHGLWQTPFTKEETEVGKFHTGHSEIEVPMMHRKGVAYYSYSEVLQADTIELPYKGENYSMVIALPRTTQTLKNMTEYLHLYNVQEISRNLQMDIVDYKIPKMKFLWKNSLVNPLGLEEVFRSADLSRISAQKMPISDMLHATEIEVDEQGTASSVVTAPIVIPSFSSVAGAPKHQFYVDRPFFLTLIHKPTHMVILQGAVYKPQQ